MQGLSLIAMIDVIKANPETLKQAFICDKAQKLTAEDVMGVMYIQYALLKRKQTAGGEESCNLVT